MYNATTFGKVQNWFANGSFYQEIVQPGFRDAHLIPFCSGTPLTYFNTKSAPCTPVEERRFNFSKNVLAMTHDSS